MLELDVLLRPFYEQNYQAMSEEQQRVFAEFLEEDDPILYSWLLGQERPADPRFQLLVSKIRGINQD